MVWQLLVEVWQLIAVICRSTMVVQQQAPSNGGSTMVGGGPAASISGLAVGFSGLWWTSSSRCLASVVWHQRSGSQHQCFSNSGLMAEVQLRWSNDSQRWSDNQPQWFYGWQWQLRCQFNDGDGRLVVVKVNDGGSFVFSFLWKHFLSIRI